MKANRTVGICVRVPPEMAELLSREAHSVGWSRSHLVQRILSSWVDGIPEHQGAMGFVVPRF